MPPTIRALDALVYFAEYSTQAVKLDPRAVNHVQQHFPCDLRVFSLSSEGRDVIAESLDVAQDRPDPAEAVRVNEVDEDCRAQGRAWLSPCE